MGKTKNRVVELEGRIIALESQVSALRTIVMRFPAPASETAPFPTENPNPYSGKAHIFEGGKR